MIIGFVFCKRSSKLKLGLDKAISCKMYLRQFVFGMLAIKYWQFRNPILPVTNSNFLACIHYLILDPKFHRKGPKLGSVERLSVVFCSRYYQYQLSLKKVVVASNLAFYLLDYYSQANEAFKTPIIHTPWTYILKLQNFDYVVCRQLQKRSTFLGDAY